MLRLLVDDPRNLAGVNMISSKDLQTQLIKDPTAAAWAVYKELERLHNENISLKRR